MLLVLLRVRQMPVVKPGCLRAPLFGLSITHNRQSVPVLAVFCAGDLRPSVLGAVLTLAGPLPSRFALTTQASCAAGGRPWPLGLATALMPLVPRAEGAGPWGQQLPSCFLSRGLGGTPKTVVYAQLEREKRLGEPSSAACGENATVGDNFLLSRAIIINNHGEDAGGRGAPTAPAPVWFGFWASGARAASTHHAADNGVMGRNYGGEARQDFPSRGAGNHGAP